MPRTIQRIVIAPDMVYLDDEVLIVDQTITVIMPWGEAMTIHELVALAERHPVKRKKPGRFNRFKRAFKHALEQMEDDPNG